MAYLTAKGIRPEKVRDAIKCNRMRQIGVQVWNAGMEVGLCVL